MTRHPEPSAESAPAATMSPSRFPWRVANACGVFTVVCAVANSLIPPALLDFWVRDADVGLWFCGGLLLSQLSIPGWFCYFRIGTYSMRLLAGSAYGLICILSAWVGFLMTGQADQPDAVAFLAGVFVPSITFAVVDLLAARESGYRLEHRSWRWDFGAGSEWSFGLTSLFAWVVIAAIAAAIWSYGMRMDAIAYRDIRFYLADTPQYNFAKLVWFVVLHVGIMHAVLSWDTRWIWAWLVPCMILGVEGMRRLEFYSSGTMPVYLEWDFAMLTFGFIVGQLLISLGLRILGWSLRCG